MVSLGVWRHFSAHPEGKAFLGSVPPDAHLHGEGCLRRGCETVGKGNGKTQHPLSFTLNYCLFSAFSCCQLTLKHLEFIHSV